MKRVMVCMTVLHLFNYINMRETLFDKEDRVDIILVDKTGFDSIVEPLKQSGIFDNVYIVKFDEVYKGILNKYCGDNNKLREKFLSLRIDMIFYNKTLEKFFANTNFSYNYDEMYIANYSRLANMVYNRLFGINSNLKIYFCEDGYVTYYKPPTNYKYAKETKYTKFLSAFGIKQLLVGQIDGVYLYEPKLCIVDDNLPKFAIPKIDKNNLDIVRKINKVFNYENDNFFDRKYIIFEQPFYIYNVETNEVDLYKKIIETVGEENVIVKLHPRATKNRFDEFKNIKIYNKTVPLEIILLNQVFDDKILITVNSNAVITPVMLYGDMSKVILLQNIFEIDKKDFIDDEIYDFFNVVSNMYDNQIFIPNTEEKVFDLLSEM